MSSEAQVMKKKSKRTMTPKLRFPEFRDEAGWEERRLVEICDMRAGKYVAASEISEMQTASMFPCYGGNGLRGYTKTFTHSGKFSLVGRQGALCGNITLATGQFHATEHAVVVTPKEGVEVDWLPYSLGLLNLNQYATGQAQPGLSVQVLEQVSAYIPFEQREQKKIADCLTSLDGLIAAEGRKLEALKAHKKGLIQHLFPQPGETQPRLRFPEFRDQGEWEEKALGDVSDVLMCRRIYANETNPNGGVPFYKIGTLGGVPDAFISHELFDEYKSKYNFPRIGEILITCSGTVGKCLPHDGSDAYFQDSNIVWIDNPTFEVSNEFLLSILSNVDWSTLNSTTITRIYGPDLRSLAIKFPQEAKEQQRIAACVTSLDDRITAQSEKIESLKIHKRGLMQQLFPASAEDAV